MQETLQQSMKGYLLRQIPQLKEMAEDNFRSVRNCSEEVSFKKWSVIFSKGQPIDAVYVLERGTVIEHDGEASAMCELPGEDAGSAEVAQARPIERVTPGEYFGAGCLEEKNFKAPCTLVALNDVDILKLPQSAVWNVMHEERRHIARIPLLSADVLGKAEQFMLVGKLKPWSFKAGHFIIREGEIGDELFVIEKGVCDAVKLIDGTETVLSQLRKGAFFGELAVMYDMPRTASVRAATDVTAVSLSREDILTALSPEKVEKMRNMARTQVFSQIPLLCCLDSGMKVKVASKLTAMRYKPGAQIQVEGKPTTRFHIVEIGEVHYYREGTEVARKYAAGTIGELGMMYQEPAYFTIVAVTEVKTLSISVDEILDLAGTGERPALIRALVSCFRTSLLRQIPEFQGKDDNYISHVLNHSEVVSYKAGDIIFEEGSPILAAYVVETGQVYASGTELPNIQLEADREPRRHYLAECLLSGTKDGGPPPSARYTLEAASDATVLRLPKAVRELVIK